jgi:predicted nucleic acid-binding protein
MTANQFLDTNILVYAFDSSDPAKQQLAEQLIAEAARSGTGWLSTQVLHFLDEHRQLENQSSRIGFQFSPQRPI